MKKNGIIFGLVVVLGMVAFFLVTRNSSSSIKRELRDFAVEDTASIDRVFMVTKDNRQVILNRVGDHWTVNEKYKARQDAIDILLKTLNRIRIKSPVSNSMLDNSIKMLATRNTKVEVYHKNKLIKTIYVGGPTQYQMGNFMMLEGSSVPFVVNIPGFTGYLSTRFFIEETGWRSTEIFDYNFNDIKSVSIEDPQDPKGSFRVESPQVGRYEVTSPTGAQLPNKMDTVAVRYYISKFEKLNFEFFADSTSLTVRDSLKTAAPLKILTLEDRTGKSTKLITWRRPANGKLDPDGNPLVWDNERMWALLDGESWVVVQYYVFNSIFVNFDYFATPVN